MLAGFHWVDRLWEVTMTMQYSDQAGFVDGEANGKSNGMAGADAFHKKLEPPEQRTVNVHRATTETAGPTNSPGSARKRFQPGTPLTWTLRKLARALQFSADCDRSKWDFAVELADLDSLQVSHDELRWMIGKGLVEHAREVSEGNGIGRTFDRPGGFTFSPQSCFVVTSTGLQLANELASEFGSEFLYLPLAENEEQNVAGVVLQPVWDDQRHELRLGDVVVKKFKWRAANQEAILAAFQEDGWPARIDDPLSPVPESDPKRRLGDTIKCLNRKQQSSLLRFSGDGTGEGVLWDVVDPGD